jgi:hypothetical protein
MCLLHFCIIFVQNCCEAESLRPKTAALPVKTMRHWAGCRANLRCAIRVRRRSGLVRFLLLESALPACLGGVFGLLLTHWSGDPRRIFRAKQHTGNIVLDIPIATLLRFFERLSQGISGISYSNNFFAKRKEATDKESTRDEFVLGVHWVG